jgi:hypothetical protein
VALYAIGTHNGAAYGAFVDVNTGKTGTAYEWDPTITKWYIRDVLSMLPTPTGVYAGLSSDFGYNSALTARQAARDAQQPPQGSNDDGHRATEGVVCTHSLLAPTVRCIPAETTQRPCLPRCDASALQARA